jgi:hypothetical protein
MKDTADEVATNTSTGMADEIMIMPSVSRIQVCFVLSTDMLLGSW